MGSSPSPWSCLYWPSLPNLNPMKLIWKSDSLFEDERSVNCVDPTQIIVEALGGIKTARSPRSPPAHGSVMSAPEQESFDEVGVSSNGAMRHYPSAFRRKEGASKEGVESPDPLKVKTNFNRSMSGYASMWGSGGEVHGGHEHGDHGLAKPS
eukprot:CAMPEP_0196589342 /NCGR_PEP_ID=MMETSP1081-20130531/63270_1 /TAXON_ID=36882 /ORGANISM="Pyramimonas amylifera, Strain CCMP720" /LENGTH=151 /DNA_ID=CAMNT_0041912113 /DNA_START=267 /DNA_END=722 /DNA_ORIENTATION=-